MDGIIRVFPNRNSYTPDDDMAFVGNPPLIIPEHKEVHISCTFTWDKAACEDLEFQWEGRTNKPVKLGGPAYLSEARDFVPGMYTKKNVVYTTRGCNNNCPWCIVPKLEGKLRELEIHPGNLIQDNNILQASKKHQDRVFEMLKTQRGVAFRGGLEAHLLTDHFVEGIRDLRIAELWLACDTDARMADFQKACEKLTKAGFNRNKIRCYVLSYGKDLEKDEARARAVYEAGAMPFVQLYRDFSDKKTAYPKEVERWARTWQRPAIIKAMMAGEDGVNDQL